MFVSTIRRRLLVAAVTMMTSFGLVTAAVAQNKPPLKIGFGMGLTGGMAANGKAALVSMEIWREEINKKGGLLVGPPSKKRTYDNLVFGHNIKSFDYVLDSVTGIINTTYSVTTPNSDVISKIILK
jgi:hypothetical protein